MNPIPAPRNPGNLLILRFAPDDPGILGISVLISHSQEKIIFYECCKSETVLKTKGYQFSSGTEVPISLGEKTKVLGKQDVRN